MSDSQLQRPRFVLWWSNLSEAYSTSLIFDAMKGDLYLALPAYIDVSFRRMMLGFEPGRIWVSNELQDFTLSPMIDQNKTSLTIRGRSALVIRYEDAHQVADILQRGQMDVHMTNLAGDTIDPPGPVYVGPAKVPISALPPWAIVTLVILGFMAAAAVAVIAALIVR